MEQIQQPARGGNERVHAGHASRMRPWKRVVVLTLAAVIATGPAGARGPGRPGVDALVEEPDALPPPGPKKTAAAIISIDPTQALPGNPTVPGSTVGAVGPQDVTVSVDAIRGAPAGMSFGQPMTSDSGELV